MNKKTLIIIIAAVVTILIVAGVLVYYFVLRQPPAEIPEEVKVTAEERVRLELTDEEEDKGMTLEEKISRIEKDRRLALERGEEIEPIEIEQATVKSINESDVIATTLSSDGENLYYYDPDKGEIYMSNLDGSDQKAITSANFENVYDIEWSANKDKAVIAFSENEGEDKEYALFDLNTQQVIKYDKKYQAVSLSPDQSEIVYLYKDDVNDISNISVTDPYDTSKYKPLYRYSKAGIKLAWIDKVNVAVRPDDKKVTGYEEDNVETVFKTTDDTFRVVIGDQYSVSSKESLNKKMLLFNQSDVKNPRQISLNIIDGHGLQEPKYLGIDTLVSKCAWNRDNKNVVCGVPDFWPNNMIMPDDYISERFISTDSFYKINTETQQVALIAPSTSFISTYDVQGQGVSKDGKIFYFKNRVDDKLYALNIPAGMVEEKK